MKEIIQYKFTEIKSLWVYYYLPAMHFPASLWMYSILYPSPSSQVVTAIMFSLSSLSNNEQVQENCILPAVKTRPGRF